MFDDLDSYLKVRNLAPYFHQQKYLRNCIKCIKCSEMTVGVFSEITSSS